MDPEPLFAFTHKEDIDMEKTPMTAEEYLAQVSSARSKAARVVRATVKRLPFERPQTSKAEEEKEDPAKLPTAEWKTMKLSLFERHKEDLLQSRIHTPSLSISWPELDSPDWINIILKEPILTLSTTIKGSTHRGTPPTPSILFSLSNTQVLNLLLILTQYFSDKVEYNKELFEWIHALLLLTEKPLLHDLCSSLRTFVRKLKKLRSRSDSDQLITNGCSFFILVISQYFSQFDLADK